MRIMIKGGVWKNTEDEILKAAVMKYGKNQWARISSLLVRKSAKQCKARWYEWLDPSIKKTEWTREEDEKLLHLAKLMPTQWRTVAPIVGRTPSQCLERYEKLLDAACVKDENYEPGDDPRKLRPGEIDPNPESKPARPDPVDMDEDEKEMLSEARARLANTRGKKAKRKAREKQLEEARRLASLQKRRELKAAGIDTRHRKRKRRGIDYNAEIPFEKRPPPGFFDVTDEERPLEQPKFPTTIEELEGKRRVDIEAQLRKQDIAKNKIAQRQDAPSSIMQINKLNDPEAVQKRAKLMLPAPQISDQELEEIAKMGYASDLVASDVLAAGHEATNALLANHAQTPRVGTALMRTPQRTPSGKGDAIMMEAENLARLRESQTPLLGGMNPELHPSDFSGVTPKKREIQTPNLMGTPLTTPGPSGLTPRVGMTPSRDGFSYSVTPKNTPIRDELHINEDTDVHDTIKQELQRQTELKKNLRSGLTNLPQPKNEYQIVVHPIPVENDEPEEHIDEDMSDRKAREQAEEEARQQALLAKRSKVLQRELPRPPAESLELIRQSLTRSDEDKSSFVPPTPIEQADELIRKELLALLEHDNAKYPMEQEKEKKKVGKHAINGKSATFVPEIEKFGEDALKEADFLVKEEIDFLRVAMGHEDEPFDEFSKARDACQEDLMYFPARNSYGLASVASNSDKLSALQSEFENVKRRMDEETKKAQRLEQKLKVLTHGYQIRSEKLWSMIEETFKQMYTAATELECFQTLQKQELFAAAYRIKGLKNDVHKQQELERALQQQYGLLEEKREGFQWRIEEYKIETMRQAEIMANVHAEVSSKESENEAPKEVGFDDINAGSDTVNPGENNMVCDGTGKENEENMVIDKMENVHFTSDKLRKGEGNDNILLGVAGEEENEENKIDSGNLINSGSNRNSTLPMPSAFCQEENKTLLSSASPEEKKEFMMTGSFQMVVDLGNDSVQGGCNSIDEENKRWPKATCQVNKENIVAGSGDWINNDMRESSIQVVSSAVYEGSMVILRPNTEENKKITAVDSCGQLNDDGSGNYSAQTVCRYREEENKAEMEKSVVSCTMMDGGLKTINVHNRSEKVVGIPVDEMNVAGDVADSMNCLNVDHSVSIGVHPIHSMMRAEDVLNMVHKEAEKPVCGVAAEQGNMIDSHGTDDGDLESINTMDVSMVVGSSRHMDGKLGNAEVVPTSFSDEAILGAASGDIEEKVADCSENQMGEDSGNRVTQAVMSMADEGITEEVPAVSSFCRMSSHLVNASIPDGSVTLHQNTCKIAVNSDVQITDGLGSNIGTPALEVDEAYDSLRPEDN